MADAKPTYKVTLTSGDTILASGVYAALPGNGILTVTRPDGLSQIHYAPHAWVSYEFNRD